MTAKQLTDSILQLAIQGKLVPQNPNDEPASVLLDRIREEKKRLVKEGKLKKKDLEETPINEDEIPFEIPESWEWCKLGNIVDFSKSSSTASGNINGDSWILDLEDIEKDTGKLLCKKRMKDVKSLSDKRRFFKGNVLYSKLRPYLNKVIIADEDGFCTTEILAFDFGEIYNKYAQIYLMSPNFVNYAMSGSFGTKMPRLSSKHGNEALFPVPPLVEQHRIVSKIEEILPKIEEYDVANEELEQMNAELPEKLKKSILQEAIMGKLGTQDPNDEPASVLLDRIRDEKKQLVKAGVLKKKDLIETPIEEDEKPFEIPEIWEWVRLGEIAELIGGFAFKSHEYTENGNRVIRISDISEDGFVNKSIVRHPYNNKLNQYLILEGDILMAMTGGTVGKSLFVKILPEQNMLLNQRVALIRVKEVYNDYVDLVLKSNFIKDVILHSKNSTNDNISMADIHNFIIPLPPLAEQHRIVEKIEALFAEVDHIKI